MPLEFVVGNTGKKMLYFEKQLYYRQRQNYWICIVNSCRLTLSTNGETESDYVTAGPKREHFHEEVDQKKFTIKKITQEMKIEIEKQPCQFASNVYKNGIKSLTEQGLSHTEIASEIKSFERMRNTLNSRKSKKYGKLPKEIKDIDFTDERFKDYLTTTSDQPFFRYDNKDDVNRIVIYVSNTGLSILSQSDRIHADGTFDSAPYPFYQLYLLHGYIYNKMFPVAFILFKRKNYESYTEMIRVIKELACQNGFKLNPQMIMTDFEMAASRAFEYHFPNAKIKGCYFHFRQNIRRWVNENGHKKQYDESIYLRNWIKKLTAVSMVPLEKVEEAVQIVLNEQPTDYNVHPIIQYFTNTWLDGLFKKEMWNHYESDNIRTNNHVESYNQKLNKFIISKKPNIFKFINFIQTEENFIQLQLEFCKKNPADYVSNSKEIKIFLKLKAQHESKLIGFKHYFEAVSHNVHLPWVAIDPKKSIQQNEDDLPLDKIDSILPTESLNLIEDEVSNAQEFVSNTKKRKRFSFLNPESHSKIQKPNSSVEIIDRNLILNGSEWLDDNQIFYALTQMKSQFKSIYICDPILLSNEQYPFKDLSKSIFVVHVGDHWLLLTNINHYETGNWIVYDSLNSEKYLVTLRPIFKKIKQSTSQ